LTGVSKQSPAMVQWNRSWIFWM